MPLTPSPEAPASHAPAHTIRERIVLQVGLALSLVLLAALAMPFASWLVFAAWLATALRPSLAALASRLGGRSRGAAVLMLVCFVALFGPTAAIVGLLAVDAIQLGQQLAGSASGRDALAQLVSSDDPSGLTFDPAAILGMVERYGARALELVGTVAGFSAELVLGIFVFFSATYVLLVEGPAAWRWFLLHAPVGDGGLERLRAAFHETGRGLFVGLGLTGLIQAAVATITYLALGVPRAFVLGLVTLVASILPTIGTALVWVPICIALAITGRTTAAVVLAVVGVVVVSSIDNVLRPLLTRTGHLALHPFVVLMAMLGGLSILGASGLFLGPLIARLGVEVVRMARDAGLAERTLSDEPPGP